ncbi:MAG: hypothetical protein AAF456_13580 [Planctomycetota bacterium]
MANKFLENSGATPGKLILVGVLGVIFAGVMISNFAGGPTAPQPAADRPSRIPSVATEVATEDAPADLPAESMPDIVTIEWPTMEPETVAMNNPFDLPEKILVIERARREEEERLAREREEAERRERELAEQTAAEQEARMERERIRQELEEEARQCQIRRENAIRTLQALRESGIGIALVSGESRVVEIGGQRFEVGDTVAGFRITEVRDDGSVILEFVDDHDEDN